MTIIECLESLEHAGKLEEKRTALVAGRNATLDLLFEDSCSDDKWNITSKNISVSSSGTMTIDSDYGTFHGMLMDLCARKVTGNAAKDLVEQVISGFDAESQKWLLRVLDKNLTVGVSYETYAKLLGIDTGNKFEVALAFNLEKVNGVNPVDGTFFASRKLDGVRTVAKVDLDKQEVTLISRQNKVFETLDNLKPKVLKMLSGLVGTWYLDGECCLINEKGEEDFQGIMKEVRRKDHTIENPSYCVFDILTEDEFYGKTASKNFNYRYEFLRGLQQVDGIIVLEQERMTSQEQFDKWVGLVKQNGWEGFMLRKDAPYKSGRTKDLLKVKKFMDAEYVVKSISLGDITFSVPGEGLKLYKDILKEFTIEHKGCEVHVGSGLTREQRIYYAAHPEELIGKTVTVQYFSETVNQNGGYSLRFPVCKMVYSNGRDV